MRKSVSVITAAMVVLISVVVLFALSERRQVRQDSLRRRVAQGIEGRVLTAEGNPVSGATVFFERENFLRGALPSATTDRQGRFAIRDLSPGTYLVYASKEADGYPLPTSTFHATGSIAISHVEVREQAVTSGVVVQLAPRAGRLIGRIMNAATNRPIERGAQITLRHADDPERFLVTSSDIEGNFNILIPPVPVMVEVSAPGYQSWQYRSTDSPHQPDALQLASGQTRRLDIALRRIR